MPQFFKNRGNLFPLLLVGVLLLYGTPAFAEQEPKFETVSLGQAVLLFRLAAQDDYPAALKKYVNEGTQEYFKTLDAALWPVTDPAKGWAFFFNTCVIAFGKKISSGQVPVTFYHPWSDVFLLTVWRVDNNGRGTMMTGAEMVLGDFVRHQGKPPFQTSPLWMRGDVYRPVAVGTATAESLMAFDKTFRSGAAKESWRELIPGLEKGSKLLEPNYYGAGVALTENIKELVAATVADPQDDASKAYREKLPQVLRQMNEGKMPELLKEATATLPETQAVLLKMPARDWQVFRITTFLPGKSNGLVMLSNGNNPNIYLGLSMAIADGRAKLERIDLFSFQSFYEDLAKNAGGAA